jgi:predicted ester cyclase
LFLCVLLFTCLADCQKSNSIVKNGLLKAQSEIEKQNKEIIKSWLSETDKENLGIVDKLMAEDCKVYYGKNTHNREWLKSMNDAFFQSFSDAVHVADDLIAEGDKVVARLTVKVTHTGEFMGIEPTGKQVEYHGYTLYRLEWGKIKELWMDNNATFELMMILGFELRR